MAFTKVQKELFSLSGTVLRKFPAEPGVGTTGKAYIRNKFILKTLDGRDLYVTKFGEFSAEFIGKDIKFQASKFNETSYTVEGDIEDAGDLVGASIAPTSASTDAGVGSSAAAPTRRGRPSKAKVTEQQVASEHTSEPKDPRECYREQAEAGTLKDLESAVRLAKHLGLDVKDTIGIVSLADRVGRTITSIVLESRNNR